jgi:hypothetical protein
MPSNLMNLVMFRFNVFNARSDERSAFEGLSGTLAMDRRRTTSVHAAVIYALSATGL